MIDNNNSISNEHIESKLKRVTVDLPKEYVDIVDQYCQETLITRRKWFYDAMIEKLTNDNRIEK